jgi:hypothetical protein
VILLATLLATVLFVPLAVDVPLVMVTPFTTMLDTDVLPAPLTVTVAAVALDDFVTTGVNPAAAGGPVIVTVLPAAVAV